MSLILKESPIGVTQTRPLFRLANLFRNIILHTKTKCKKLVIQCSIPGQETWAVQTSGMGNFCSDKEKRDPSGPNGRLSCRGPT